VTVLCQRSRIYSRPAYLLRMSPENSPWKFFETLSPGNLEPADCDAFWQTFHVPNRLTWHLQEAQLSLTCHQKPPRIGSIFWILLITPLPFDAPPMRGSCRAIGFMWYRKTRMAGLQSGEGRVTIDSVVWARDRHTDCHVTTPYSICRAKMLAGYREQSILE